MSRKRVSGSGMLCGGDDMHSDDTAQESCKKRASSSIEVSKVTTQSANLVDVLVGFLPSGMDKVK